MAFVHFKGVIAKVTNVGLPMKNLIEAGHNLLIALILLHDFLMPSKQVYNFYDCFIAYVRIFRFGFTLFLARS